MFAGCQQPIVVYADRMPNSPLASDNSGPACCQIIVTGACFWTLEAVLSSLKGVAEPQSGYVWMSASDPPQQSQDRFHAERMECVRFSWMPQILTPHQLVSVLLSVTSPQLAPWGLLSEMSGMRSLIAGTMAPYAQGLREALGEKTSDHPGASHMRVIEQDLYWEKASDWDQGFWKKRPQDGFSCSIIAPKVERLQKSFASLVKSSS